MVPLMPKMRGTKFSGMLTMEYELVLETAKEDKKMLCILGIRELRSFLLLL